MNRSHLASRVAAGAFAVLLLAPSLQAQEAERPEGWTLRGDRGAMDEVMFVTMEPGWHITTGPAGIFYDASRTASGDYSVESTTFMFDPQGRNEAFGIFVGGQDLDGAGQRYLYFLVRPSGEFLVKERNGSETPVHIGWTAHDAVMGWEDRGEGEETVENVLRIEADGAQVRFLVNGAEVASQPRGSLPMDGVVGLRVNHRVNIHVSSLDVAQP